MVPVVVLQSGEILRSTQVLKDTASDPQMDTASGHGSPWISWGISNLRFEQSLIWMCHVVSCCFTLIHELFVFLAVDPSHYSYHVVRSAAVQEMQFDGLVPGEIYNLSVAAVSAAGVGPFTQELVAWIRHLLRGHMWPLARPWLVADPRNCGHATTAQRQATWSPYIRLPLAIFPSKNNSFVKY